MADKDLSELFIDTLKDIYYAEKQIYKPLPKMAKAAASDQSAPLLRSMKCDAIEGILHERKEIMHEYATLST